MRRGHGNDGGGGGFPCFWWPVFSLYLTTAKPNLVHDNCDVLILSNILAY